MLNRRQFAQLGFAGAALAALPKWSLAAADSAPVLWGPPVAPTVLLALAAQNAALQKAYPGIHAQTWRSPDQLRAGLANKSMPLTMVPSYVAANFRNQGQDVGLLNIMTFGLLYIVGKDDSVTSLEDLAGKKLVMPFKQDMPDLVLQALLKKANIDISKIDIQYTATPPEALLLFMSGKADLALLPEPAVSMAQIKGKSMNVSVARNLSLQALWGDYMGGEGRIPQAGLLATRAFYDEQKALLSTLNGALDEAVSTCASDPKLAAETATKALEVPAPVLATAIPHSNLSNTSATDINDEILSFFEVLYQLNPKITGGKMADESLFWSMPS